MILLSENTKKIIYQCVLTHTSRCQNDLEKIKKIKNLDPVVFRIIENNCKTFEKVLNNMDLFQNNTVCIFKEEELENVYDVTNCIGKI